MISFTFLQSNFWDVCNNIETMPTSPEFEESVEQMCRRKAGDDPPKNWGVAKLLSQNVTLLVVPPPRQCHQYLPTNLLTEGFSLLLSPLSQTSPTTSTGTGARSKHRSPTPQASHTALRKCRLRQGEWGNTYLALLGTQNLRQLREPLLARSDPRVMMPHRQSS